MQYKKWQQRDYLIQFTCRTYNLTSFTSTHEQCRVLTNKIEWRAGPPSQFIHQPVNDDHQEECETRQCRHKRYRPETGDK